MDKTTRPIHFWVLWTEELPVLFQKKRLTDALQKRWGLSYQNVLSRLKKERFPDLISDLQFLYYEHGIGFTIDKGFYFDREKFDEIADRKERELAAKYGLVVVVL